MVIFNQQNPFENAIWKMPFVQVSFVQVSIKLLILSQTAMVQLLKFGDG